MPIRKGDLLLYNYREYPQGCGSLAIAIRNEYDDDTCEGSHRGVDVDWIAAADPALANITDFNIECFEKIGHIDVPKHPRRKKS